MAKVEPVVNVNSISRISAGTVIKGEIVSPYDIRIDGTFEGKIQSKGRVVIGESAHIKGDILGGDLLTVGQQMDRYGGRALAVLVIFILPNDVDGHLGLFGRLRWCTGNRRICRKRSRGLRGCRMIRRGGVFPLIRTLNAAM